MTTRSIGQFYPVASPLHALDPRAKILATAVLVVGLFLVDSVAGLLVLAAGFVLLLLERVVGDGALNCMDDVLVRDPMLARRAMDLHTVLV